VHVRHDLVACLHQIIRHVLGGNFGQSEIRFRIDQPRIHRHPGQVNHLRACRNLDRSFRAHRAEIWCVADTLGSLDVGKMANVVVANGDPLDVKTDVKRVFIGGQEIPMKSRQTELRDQYMK